MPIAPLPPAVLVDDGPASARALTWAAQEAARRHCSVRLVTTTGEGCDPVVVRRAHDRLVAARRAALAAEAVLTSTQIVPDHELHRLGDQAAVVVVGAGPGVLRVIEAVGCPVVAVPWSWDPVRHAGEVIVAVDAADPEKVRRRTLAVAATTAYRWDRPLLVAVVAPETQRAAAAAARRTFDACADDVGAHVTVHEVFGHGDPVEEVGALIGPSTGLLVLGGLGRTGRALLARARCPVVVVPAVAAAAVPVGVSSAAGRG